MTAQIAYAIAFLLLLAGGGLLFGCWWKAKQSKRGFLDYDLAVISYGMCIRIGGILIIGALFLWFHGCHLAGWIE